MNSKELGGNGTPKSANGVIANKGLTEGVDMWSSLYGWDTKIDWQGVQDYG